VASKKGLFEMADGGSVFFDEIGNIPLDTQAKLLRVIQEREFMRLGGLETIRVDVRIIAATNADLETGRAAGAVPRGPVLPAERHQREPAAPAQADGGHSAPFPALLGQYARENEKAIRTISPPAMELLLDHHWPGNVRELENAIERAVVLSIGETLVEELLPSSVRQREATGLLPPTLPRTASRSRTSSATTSARSSSAPCKAAAACRSGPPSCCKSSPRRSTR